LSSLKTFALLHIENITSCAYRAFAGGFQIAVNLNVPAFLSHHRITMERDTAAVIGLGASGLVALKNLKEQGFEVTGFERSSYIGGLWNYSEDDSLSVLSTTVVNVSKERVCIRLVYRNCTLTDG
jgi:heterodisulfide reductase subunit A-like polyferredoxin